MIDIFDSEAIVKTYRLLRKKCDALNKFIENHAFYFGTSSTEYGALDVCNNIIDLMERKNKLINFKIIVDSAINTLSDKDKKILFIKMHYNISMKEICGILSLKERTAFRHIEKAFESLANALNNSKYYKKLEQILLSEDWILAFKDDIKVKRLNYKAGNQMVSSL